MNTFYTRLSEAMAELRKLGLYKEETVLASQQGPVITTHDGGELLNFCSNNYLGLANHPDIHKAVRAGLKRRGYGLSSVRFICGTQEIHKELERAVADFIGKEDALLFTTCFDANTAVFEPMLGPEDVIISDALNHASIIDGVRLCKAQSRIFQHTDMADLEKQLQEAVSAGGLDPSTSKSVSARTIIVVTDGVFSMDGDMAKLPDITALAERFGALVMVDESHATGVIGPQGRGVTAHFGLTDKVALITSTFSKALGGGSGGFIAGDQVVIDFLRQKARPYLFSTSLPPVLVAGALAAIEIAMKADDRRARLIAITKQVRAALAGMGYELKPGGQHPITPVMLYDAPKAQAYAKALRERGILAVGFFYPVVPQGQARIRLQLSAAHTDEHVGRLLEVCKELVPTSSRA
ncbi:MAG: glycine C-acetyltransferase [Parcubacteria group bacterium RIFCSPHIGHO2_01_FULL_47_10b]|nr:MAG: glycine C-acetyltransferase [Parcubacteria group bacterium RIFCSPHIGHO2_01_FULL_47_10b]